MKNDTEKTLRIKNSMQHDVVNYSITNIIDIFKTKLINKYNNDIKKMVKI